MRNFPSENKIFKLPLEIFHKVFIILIRSIAGKPDVLDCSCWWHSVLPDCVKIRIQSPSEKEEQGHENDIYELNPRNIIAGVFCGLIFRSALLLFQSGTSACGLLQYTLPLSRLAGRKISLKIYC